VRQAPGKQKSWFRISLIRTSRDVGLERTVKTQSQGALGYTVFESVCNALLLCLIDIA